MKSNYRFIFVALFLVVGLLANQFVNQRAFYQVFGFYSPANFLQMKAKVSGCFDCDHTYLRFRPSENELNKILSEKGCKPEKYQYDIHGDSIGFVASNGPEWLKKCTRGKMCASGDGAIWYDQRTGYMCFARLTVN